MYMVYHIWTPALRAVWLMFNLFLVMCLISLPLSIIKSSSTRMRMYNENSNMNHLPPHCKSFRSTVRCLQVWGFARVRITIPSSYTIPNERRTDSTSCRRPFYFPPLPLNIRQSHPPWSSDQLATEHRVNAYQPFNKSNYVRLSTLDYLVISRLGMHMRSSNAYTIAAIAYALTFFFYRRCFTTN